MAAVSAAPDSGEAVALRDLNALAAYGGRRFLVCGTLQFIYPRALVERRRDSAASYRFDFPDMAIEDLVSAAVINYQTPDLLDTAVRSFHSHYPGVTILVIDNGSSDESPAVIEALSAELGSAIEARVLNENRYHGPAMDLALRELETDYVYIFDSDTETLRSGFLEQIMLLASRDGVYGVGQIVHVNKRGFAVKAGIPVLVSAHMLINRSVYLTLPPFIHHGLPALANFKAASERGLRLESYPISGYVKHFGRGTAERFGYGLGLRSRLDYLLNKIGL